MTDQITALRELVAKVEAGNPVADIELVLALEGDHTGLPSIKAINAAMAINGSLNAAKALHEALLPNYSAEARLSGFGGAQAAVWNPMIAPSAGQDIRVDHPDNPARAWLIAILKAKIAELEAAQ